MEEKSYINEELSLVKRMKSVFLPLFASMIILFTIVAMLNGKVEWFIYFLLISIYTIFFAIVTYFQSKSYIYAVRIKETRIIIDGQSFNTKWTDIIEICNLKIEIKGEAQGKGHSEYVIILKSPDKSYKINSLYNWDYFKLIELFKELKISKGEKIIFDENFLINRIEKKALGNSIIDINFGE